MRKIIGNTINNKNNNIGNYMEKVTAGEGPVIFHISSNEQQPPKTQSGSALEAITQKAQQIIKHHADKDMQGLVKLFPQHSKEEIEIAMKKHQPLIGEGRITLIKELVNLEDKNAQQAKKRADNRTKAQTKARVERGGLDPVEEAHPQAEEAAALQHGKIKKKVLVKVKSALNNLTKKGNEEDFFKKKDKGSLPLETTSPENEKPKDPLQKNKKLHRGSKQLDYLDRMPSSRDPQDPGKTIKKTHAKQRELTDNKFKKLEQELLEKNRAKETRDKFAMYKKATLDPVHIKLPKHQGLKTNPNS